MLNRCPDFKGIETHVAGEMLAAEPLNRCPDFKGIETRPCGAPASRLLLNRCPDFKGIETSSGIRHRLPMHVEPMP